MGNFEYLFYFQYIEKDMKANKNALDTLHKE